jgi:peptidylprolyl isomerase
MKKEKLSAGVSVPKLWLSAALVLCCAFLLVAGCTSPHQSGVKANDTVRVNYTASFGDGTVFDTTMNRTPLEITVGSGQVISGFDEAVIGMVPGQTKTVVVPPEKGYGIYNKSLVYRVNQEDVKTFLQEQRSQGNLFVFQYPGIGSGYSWTNPDESRGYMQLTNITDTMVTVDLNNPLAGKNLTFEITLVEIVKNTP